MRLGGALNARSTTLTSSRRSNGFGRYSNAPRSAALTAVSSVVCALMTMTRRSGRSRLMRGIRSRPFSSGMTTSVMTRSPSPSATHRHKVAAFPVIRTSWPRRASAWFSTMRIARSSSATRIVALIIRHRLAHSRRRSRLMARQLAGTPGTRCAGVGCRIRSRRRDRRLPWRPVQDPGQFRCALS